VARSFRYYEKKRGHRRTGSRLFGSVGEALFFAALLLLGSGGVVAGIVWLVVPEWRVNHHFIEHTCTVKDKRVVSDQREKGTLYRPEVLIEYADPSLPGRTISTWTYDVHARDANSPLTSRDEAQAAIDRFERGQTYPCWYDPLNPGDAVLVRGYQWWIWPALLIPASFIVTGIGGLVYTALHWGRSAERRAAAVRSVPAPELFDLPATVGSKFPYVPDGNEITSSPGTRLAYRLPLTRSPGWTLVGLLAACVAWNGTLSVFLVMAIRSFLARTPDWPMTFFSVPFLVVGVALVLVFVRFLRDTAGIGPTLVEISDHPLLPGNRYRLFLSQSGNLTLKAFDVSLICEEEGVFRQGTNVRTENREVFRQSLYAGAGAVIRPSEPLETECDLPIPAQAMHSFRAAHNQIQWKLIVRGDVAGWHAFERSFPVVVRPMSAAHVSGGSVR
jgi:hypothetical protein